MPIKAPGPGKTITVAESSQPKVLSVTKTSKISGC